MENEKVFAMSFARVYPMLIAKAERKGRPRDEVLEVTAWLTGYTADQIEELIEDPLMQKIRYLDKLVDKPAKGKAMEKILR